MLLWIDLETTGLDPRADEILEIALVVTDNELGVLHQESHVLPFDLAEAGRKVNDYVLKMHEDNGLWAACRQAHAAAAEGVGDERVETYLKVLQSMRRFTEPRTTPICGSTIAFDRGFLRHHVPALEAHFSHRNLDVSVLGELAARWAPETWEKRPKGGGHRALPDILGSIELLRYWRGTLLHEDLREGAL